MSKADLVVVERGHEDRDRGDQPVGGANPDPQRPLGAEAAQPRPTHVSQRTGMKEAITQRPRGIGAKRPIPRLSNVP